LPSNLRTRISTAVRDETPRAGQKPAVTWSSLWQDWAEFLLPAAIGVAVWLLFNAK
jgi:hypothetical protein